MVGKIVRGISSIFIGRVISTIADGVLIILLTQYFLSPNEYGQLFLTISVLSIALLFANLGFGKSAARYITDYRKATPELVGIVIRKTLFYNFSAITVVCGVIYLLNERIAVAIGEPDIATLLLFGTGYIVFMSLKATTIMIFQGLNQMKWVTIIGIISKVAMLIAVPSFLLLGYGLEGAISGYTVGYSIAALMGIIVIYNRFYPREGIDKSKEKEVSSKVLRYSIPLTLTKGANTIDSWADTILLSVYRGPTSIAFYTLGKQLADFLIMPAQSLGFAISPTYGERKASGDLTRAAQLYEQSFIYTIALYGPIAAGVILVSNPAVRLIFGISYAGAGPILQVFSIFIFVRSIDKITNDGLDFLGRANERASAKGVLALANVILNLLLIPPFGAIGATIATVSTYSVLVGVELFIIVDELPINGSRLLKASLTVGGIAVAMSAVVYPLVQLISGIPSLAAVIGVGGIIWAISIVLTGIVDVRQILSSLA